MRRRHVVPREGGAGGAGALSLIFGCGFIGALWSAAAEGEAPNRAQVGAFFFFWIFFLYTTLKSTTSPVTRRRNTIGGKKPAAKNAPYSPNKRSTRSRRGSMIVSKSGANTGSRPNHAVSAPPTDITIIIPRKTKGILKKNGAIIITSNATIWPVCTLRAHPAGSCARATLGHKSPNKTIVHARGTDAGSPGFGVFLAFIAAIIND